MNWTATRYAHADMKRNERIVEAAVLAHLKEFPEDKGKFTELNKGVFSDELGIPTEKKQNERVRKAAGR